MVSHAVVLLKHCICMYDSGICIQCLKLKLDYFNSVIYYI